MMKKYTFFIFLLGSSLLHSSTHFEQERPQDTSCVSQNSTAEKSDPLQNNTTQYATTTNYVYELNGKSYYRIKSTEKKNETSVVVDKIGFDSYIIGFSFLSAIIAIYTYNNAKDFTKTLQVFKEHLTSGFSGSRNTLFAYLAASVFTAVPIKGLYNYTQTGSFFHNIQETTNLHALKNGERPNFNTMERPNKSRKVIVFTSTVDSNKEYADSNGTKLLPKDHAFLKDFEKKFSDVQKANSEFSSFFKK